MLAVALCSPAAIHSDVAAAYAVGDDCVADGTEPDSTLLVLNNHHSGAPPQVRVVGPGVITSWRVDVAPGQAPIAQQLVVLDFDYPGGYRKTAVSPVEQLNVGTNQFPIRLPVDESAHVGLHGPVETLLCAGQPKAVSGRYLGDLPLGETRAPEEVVGIGTPVTVEVESDQDGDGFGDSSQDSCPTDPLRQSGCLPPAATDLPSPSLSVRSVVVKPRAIVVGVEVSFQTQVQVFGQVSWQVRQRDGSNRGLTQGVSAGAPRTVAPGAVASFRVQLEKTVLRRLARLTPQQSLRAQVTARTIDAAGREVDHGLTVKLRGHDRG